MADWDDYREAVRVLAELGASEARERDELAQRASRIVADARQEAAARVAEADRLVAQAAGLQRPMDELLRAVGVAAAPASDPGVRDMAGLQTAARDVETWLRDVGPRLESLQRTRNRLASAPVPVPPPPVPVPTQPRSNRVVVMGVLGALVVIAFVLVLVLNRPA